jgi:hypothetical protein
MSNLRDQAAVKRVMTIDPLDVGDYNKLAMKMAPKSAMPPGVRPLVRYVNALPTMRSRVILKPIGTDVTTTFINANFVPSFDESNPKACVCACYPLPTTLHMSSPPLSPCLLPQFFFINQSITRASFLFRVTCAFLALFDFIDFTFFVIRHLLIILLNSSTRSCV